MSVFTPVNQVRLTNVAVVRLHKRGKRFEIACYRNKVLSWRNKLETDLREVLQIDTVFTNVSKGMLANAKDLQDAFGTSDQAAVCQEILDKGELQVSEQERGALYETIFRDIASIVVDKTVNPENNKPYTVALIQNAMKQIQYSVNVSKSSKSQALEVIRKLRDIMPIARASMLLRLVYKPLECPTLLTDVETIGGMITFRSQHEAESTAEAYADIKIDPELFRKIEDLVKSVGSNTARLEVLQMRMAAAAPVAGSGVSAATESKQQMHESDSEDEPVVTKDSQKASKKKSASSTGGSKKEVPKRRHDLQQLLSEVTGMEDIVEDVPDDYEIVEQLVQNRKGRKKGKKAEATDITDKTDASDIHVDREENVSVVSSKVSESTTISTTATGTAKVKQSKKDKKLQKEEQSDREREAQLLQERILEQKRKTKEEQEKSVVVETPVALEPTGASASSAIGKVSSCNTCGGSFQDSKEYRDHFKSEWHRFNLKRKMKNLSIIPSEAEFLQLSIEQLQL